MTSKHTPGPWRFDADAGEIYGRPQDGEVVVVYSGGLQFESDGDLIAAAPEMYQALQRQVRNCPLCKGTTRAVSGIDLLKGDNVETDCQRCADGRAALAKAEGKK